MPTLHARRISLALAALLALAGCRKQITGADGARPDDPAGGHPGSTGGAADTQSGPHNERVEIHTSDGWTLVADLRQGSPTRPAVVLVHQLSSNRGEWAPLIARLHRGNTPYTTLTLDARGHGESTRGPDGPTRWQQFGNDSSRWDGMRRDVAAAISYLRAQHLDSSGFVLVGSSIGSTAVVRAAADEPAVLKLVMLSPGLAYRGLDTLEPLQRYASAERPVFLVAGDGDNTSADAAHALAARARGVDRNAIGDSLRADAGTAPDAVGAAGPDAERVHEQIVTGTGAHGVALAAPGVHPALWDEIAAWIDTAPIAPSARGVPGLGTTGGYVGSGTGAAAQPATGP